MNTQIKKILMHRISSLSPKGELDCEARELVNSHNNSVMFGLIEHQELIYSNCDFDENKITITVHPRSGQINIHDLYNLKELWGADDLNVLTDGIELVFKK